jgi:hypothetical protein
MIGATVRILWPFEAAYPGEYVVTMSETTNDGQVAYFVDGIDGGFDVAFLEVVNHGA